MEEDRYWSPSFYVNTFQADIDLQHCSPFGVLKQVTSRQNSDSTLRFITGMISFSIALFECSEDGLSVPWAWSIDIAPLNILFGRLSFSMDPKNAFYCTFVNCPSRMLIFNKFKRIVPLLSNPEMFKTYSPGKFSWNCQKKL